MRQGALLYQGLWYPHYIVGLRIISQLLTLQLYHRDETNDYMKYSPDMEVNAQHILRFVQQTPTAKPSTTHAGILLPWQEHHRQVPIMQHSTGSHDIPRNSQDAAQKPMLYDEDACVQLRS